MQRKLSVLIGLVFFLSACKKDPEPQPEPILLNKFINAKNYRQLVVEIISEKGMTLQSGTIAYVRKFLEKTLDKPGGIEIVQKEITAASERRSIHFQNYRSW